MASGVNSFYATDAKGGKHSITTAIVNIDIPSSMILMLLRCATALTKTGEFASHISDIDASLSLHFQVRAYNPNPTVVFSDAERIQSDAS